MNEVGPTVGAAMYVANSASSKGAGPINQKDGNSLPDEAIGQNTEADQKESNPYPNGIRSAVVEVNTYVQSIQRDLQFDVDQDLEKTIVKVIDSNSGDVIRQIPEDIFLELARRLNQEGEMHLVDALG